MKQLYYTAFRDIPSHGSGMRAHRLTFSTSEGIRAISPSMGNALLGISVDTDKMVQVGAIDGIPFATIKNGDIAVFELDPFPAAVVRGEMLDITALQGIGMAKSYFREYMYIREIPEYMRSEGYVWSEGCAGWVKRDGMLSDIERYREIMGTPLSVDNANARICLLGQKGGRPC